MTTLLVRAGTLITGTGEQIKGGWLLNEDGWIREIGFGEAPGADDVLDLPNCAALPGLINAHDHLFQWSTRGYAPDSGLIAWLTHLYPTWAGVDTEVVWVAARAGLARLLLSGCTLTSDHHYLVPNGAVSVFEALFDAAAELGIRFHLCRGCITEGNGIAPRSFVEDEDKILSHIQDLVNRHHDPAPGAMQRVAVAPGSLRSTSPRFLVRSAELARRLGLRLHTHLAETPYETHWCAERYGRRPLEVMEEAGWIGDDVWFAHCIHLSPPEIERLGRSRTGIAHCPSSNMRLGSGACPVVELMESGASVGLGVDGAASNESANLGVEVHQAMLLARVRAALTGKEEPASEMSARTAWGMAGAGGAACLGRPDCGRLEVGACADVALFRLDDLEHCGMNSALDALALAPPARAEAVVVGGRVVVREGHLLVVDEEELARDLARVSLRLRQESGA